MGSHISYWDRYPGEFYHWPVDTSKERETAEVMNDEYDNSVLFNDYVMESIMNEATNYCMLMLLCISLIMVRGDGPDRDTMRINLTSPWFIFHFGFICLRTIIG